DRALIAGKTLRYVCATFGLTMPSLCRHKHNHLLEMLAGAVTAPLRNDSIAGLDLPADLAPSGALSNPAGGSAAGPDALPAAVALAALTEDYGLTLKRELESAFRR